MDWLRTCSCSGHGLSPWVLRDTVAERGRAEVAVEEGVMVSGGHQGRLLRRGVLIGLQTAVVVEALCSTVRDS